MFGEVTIDEFQVSEPTNGDTYAANEIITVSPAEDNDTFTGSFTITVQAQYDLSSIATITQDTSVQSMSWTDLKTNVEGATDEEFDTTSDFKSAVMNTIMEINRNLGTAFTYPTDEDRYDSDDSDVSVDTTIPPVFISIVELGVKYWIQRKEENNDWVTYQAEFYNSMDRMRVAQFRDELPRVAETLSYIVLPTEEDE